MKSLDLLHLRGIHLVVPLLDLVEQLVVLNLDFLALGAAHCFLLCLSLMVIALA